MLVRNIIIFITSLCSVSLYPMDFDFYAHDIQYVEKEPLPNGESGEGYSTKLPGGNLIRAYYYATGSKEIECYMWTSLYSPGSSKTYKQKISSKVFWILQKKFKDQSKKNKSSKNHFS